MRIKANTMRIKANTMRIKANTMRIKANTMCIKADTMLPNAEDLQVTARQDITAGEGEGADHVLSSAATSLQTQLTLLSRS
ncbi:hypothetical protein E6O75_ATG08308 [Venturia nashicola]|uniref:Uncharacterized protein n=1 Tax=Venturia nashicola TaxID=86259 RepID=A0A4Z1NNM5_9PEZI|nr:hypothetical protein E6O75_ATG08308 [Venturia nashicola]